jgi:hypothetical protein
MIINKYLLNHKKKDLNFCFFFIKSLLYNIEKILFMFFIKFIFFTLSIKSTNKIKK